MKLQGCSNAFSGVLFGLAFFSCGLIFLLVFGHSYTLRCSRAEPSQLTCTRERRWLRVLTTGDVPVEGLSEAWVGESCDEDGCTYRVELGTNQGQIGLTGYYSSGYDEKAIIASEINTFVTDPRIPELEVRSDAGLFGFLLPTLFVVIGIVAALASLWRLLSVLLAGGTLLTATKK